MEQNDFSNSESPYCPDGSQQGLVQSIVWFEDSHQSFGSIQRMVQEMSLEEFQDGRHLGYRN